MALRAHTTLHSVSSLGCSNSLHVKFSCFPSICPSPRLPPPRCLFLSLRSSPLLSFSSSSSSSSYQSVSHSLFDLARALPVKLKVLSALFFSFLLLSPDSQILSRAVWVSLVTSHAALLLLLISLTFFSLFSADKALPFTLSFMQNSEPLAAHTYTG